MVVPVTVAANCWVALVCRAADFGLIETPTGGALVVTVIVALALFVPSATLVALTVYVPAVVGAVYSPELEIDPWDADQVTTVFVVPVTVALNCCVAPVCNATELGTTETARVGGEAITVTVAVPDWVGSAVLVAMTTYVPVVAGALYRPDDVIVPPEVDQVTPVSLLPVTVAVNC